MLQLDLVSSRSSVSRCSVYICAVFICSLFRLHFFGEGLGGRRINGRKSKTRGRGAGMRHTPSCTVGGKLKHNLKIKLPQSHQ